MPHGLPKGHKKSEETKRKMSEGALLRPSRIIGRYGYTEEMVNAALAKGLVWCSDCKKFLDASEFGNQKSKTRCLPCGKIINRKRYYADPEGNREYRIKWQKDNPDLVKASSRKQNLRQYGVDEVWYERTLAEQKGHCCLCPRTHVTGRKYLFIDHDHETGRVRGLLCDTCNFHLHSIEKPGWADAAIAYLRRFGRDPCLASAELPNITP